ncbi:hypothetical protein [Burkholderia territorii]|uniref:hypothetical protein n=1 Tax=Burkholderia territorii TaxID=1503055 RepID=UPI000B328E49|nr:hypothetical protein [Burkholderia territorii]
MKLRAIFCLAFLFAVFVDRAAAQSNRTWYFPDGRTAVVMEFDSTGFRTKSTVYGPNGKPSQTAIYTASAGGGRNCGWGSAKFDRSRYSCLIGDVSNGYQPNVILFNGTEESWGAHGVKRHSIINGQKWTWFARGLNNDKAFANITIQEVVVENMEGRMIANYVLAPDGNFMDNMFHSRPESERPRYYLTTARENMNVAHFVPLVGNKVETTVCGR